MCKVCVLLIWGQEMAVCRATRPRKGTWAGRKKKTGTWGDRPGGQGSRQPGVTSRPWGKGRGADCT